MALIIPELYADALSDELDVSLRLGSIAVDMTELAPEITTCGDTIHMPMVTHIGDAQDVPTDGSEMTPERLSMTDHEVKVKHKGKTVLVSDKESAQVKANIDGILGRQLGDVVAKAIDTSLAEDILACDAYVDEVDTLTEDAIESAFDVFGDKQDDNSFVAIVINSRLRKAIKHMGAFSDDNNTFTADGNGRVMNGVIGLWNGEIPVILSNNGTYNASTGKAMFALVKKGALGVIIQKQPTIKEAYNVRSFGTDVNTSVMFATAANENGISVLLVGSNG